MGMSHEAVRNDRNRRRAASASASATASSQCGANSSSEDGGLLQPAHAELVAAAERGYRDTLGAIDAHIVR